MTVRVFFAKEHTDVLLEALFYHMNALPRTSPKMPVAKQAWDMLTEAYRGKRFLIEAETERLEGRGGGDLIIKR